MVESFAAPHMQRAAERKKEHSTEKIEDSKTVISLQNLLTEKKVVQITVQAEMKTSSSVLTRTFPATLAPKRIKAAVQNQKRWSTVKTSSFAE